MKVKDFMKEHKNDLVHLHWDGDPVMGCIGMDAYSSNQDLAKTHGEKEIVEWRFTTEYHYDKNWNYVPMRVVFVVVNEC